jgi:ketosteroid isomerase-like protein
MSEEANVQLVRGLAEAFQRRDHEWPFALYDSEIEWDASRLTERLPPDLAAVYKGHEGVRAYWRGWLSAWKDLQFDVHDVRAAGDEVVLLISNQRQWGRHSGIETEMPSAAMAFKFRGGKIVRCRLYPSHEAALEAVGL